MLGLSYCRRRVRQFVQIGEGKKERRGTNGLALRDALVLPAPLGSDDGEHAGFGRTDSRDTDGLSLVVVEGSVEEASDHVDAASLDFAESGVCKRRQFSTTKMREGT